MVVVVSFAPEGTGLGSDVGAARVVVVAVGSGRTGAGADVGAVVDAAALIADNDCDADCDVAADNDPVIIALPQAARIDVATVTPPESVRRFHRLVQC